MAITLISTVTVGAGGAASIDFTSIPGTYTDLMVVFSCRDTSGGNFNNIYITLNGTSSGYSDRILYGTGSSAASGSNTGLPYFLFAYAVGATATSNTFGNGQMYFPNYAGSTNKSLSIDSVSENNAAGAIQAMSAQLWSNTAAINRVTLGANTPYNFVQYSSASLYGITKGSSGGVTVS